MPQRLESAVMSFEEFGALRRFSPLDGLRAIAVLLVVVVHCRGQGVLGYLAGWNGVTIFFVLSGFLITTLALREEQRAGRVAIAAFYVRRGFRILPLYLVALGLWSAVVLLVGLGDRSKFVAALPSYLSPLPELPYFAGQGHVPFEVAWSLGIEEKFYLLWPLLAFGVLALAKRGRLPMCLMLIIVIWALQPFGTLVTRMVFPYLHILIGCAAALALADPSTYGILRRVGERAFLVPAAVAAVGLQLATHFGLPQTVYPLYTLCVAACLVGLVVRRRAQTGVLAGPVVGFVARISFALYLTHQLALNSVQRILPDTLAGNLATLVLGLALAIPFAYLLHRTIELPLIGLGRRIVRGDRRPVIEAAPSVTLSAPSP